MRYPEHDLKILSDAELAEYLLSAETDKADADVAIKKLKNEIINRKADELIAAYSQKPEPYGIVSIPLGDKIAKIDVVKIVEWDQDQLEALWKQIASDGADPKEYIVIDYRVLENKYKIWGDNIKAFFAPARIVKNRAPTVKIIEKEI